MNGKRITGLLLVALGLTILTLKLARVYDPAPQISKLSIRAGKGVAQFVKAASPDMVVYILLAGLPICIGGLFLAAGQKPAAREAEKTKASHSASAVVHGPSTRGGRSIQSANVLQVGPNARHLWQFDARNGSFSLNREQTTLNGEALPGRIVGKSWTSLWQKKLNIAWLPPEHVFLRVAHFPTSEFKETVAMVELQLEKLSPIPVAQVVWSIQILPHASGNMQTVIIMLVSRNIVEEFLGQLEGQGFLADALELPIIDQIQATPVQTDGVWIYPEGVGGHGSALAAWWYGGVLQNLDLINLPATNKFASVREQLTQMAWAGELEGWLTSPPIYHLVAAGASATEWEPVLREGLDQSIEVVEPPPPPRLAGATARRSAAAPLNASLLPAEYSLRYQQQFVDRLWMRGLMAIGGIYLVGVAIYAVALSVANYQTSKVESRVTALGGSYTNALQLETKYQILQERQDLKFAALDCWKAVAENMPETLTLENCNFNDGRRFTLNGTAPNDQIQTLYKFDTDLKKYLTLSGQPLFDSLRSDIPTIRQINPTTVTWNLNLELKRSEAR